MTRTEIVDKSRDFLILANGKIVVPGGWEDEQLLNIMANLENWITEKPNRVLLQKSLLEDYLIYCYILKDNIFRCVDFSRTKDWRAEVEAMKIERYREAFGE